MSGIALFVPDQEMYQQAQSLIRSLDNHHIAMVKVITTKDIVSEARKAAGQGINIIIARGRQAMEIQNNTGITVTNIIITAQELGLLIRKAKKMIDKEHITVGLFGWGDMFCDTTHFDQLYNITLKRYNLQEHKEWRNTILNAVGDELDIIIGGKATMECANQIGIPSLYLSGTSESLAVAIRAAESLYHMSEIEKHNYAQFSTVLDSSSNGIIKLSTSGRVLIMNRIMEEITGQNSDRLIGMSIDKAFPGISPKNIMNVLNGQSDNYSTLLTYQNQELVLIVEPIIVDGSIAGAIMSFNRLRRLSAADNRLVSKQLVNGYIAYNSFDNVSQNQKGLHDVIELAKLYALSSSPMLIQSLSGPELDMIAQGIHNYSMRRNGPFIMLNMAGLTEEQQIKTLFGDPAGKDPGAILSADKGTLVLQGIDKLTLPNQYNFTKAIRSKRLSPDNNLANAKIFDTRIIACTAKNLTELRSQFQFRSDLYFTLNSLRLKIPNLNERPEDVAYLLETYTKQFMQQYSRYHVLTARARQVLLDYPWEGNSIQLQSFCERMILTVQNRSITEDYVLALLEELYHQDTDIGRVPLEYESVADLPPDDSLPPMQDLIYRTLKKYNGNRKLTARELQISTTTLWRKMKLFGLNDL